MIRRDGVTCLDFDRERFLVGRRDGLVIVAALDDATPRAVLRHPDAITQARFSREHVRVACADRVFTWDLARGVPIEEPPGARVQGPGRALRLSDDDEEPRVTLIGDDDGAVRLAHDGHDVAVVRYGEHGVPRREDGAGRWAPDAWCAARTGRSSPPRSPLPSPPPQLPTPILAPTTNARRRSRLARDGGGGAPSVDRVAHAIAQLRVADPEARARAADALAACSDRRALVPLEDVALHDDGSFAVEGAFVDSYRFVHADALASLAGIARRVGADDDDRVRLRSLLLRVGVDRVEDVLAAWRARDVLDEARAHPSPAVRVRAANVSARLDRRPPHGALVDDDEDVRVAAALQDEYAPGLVAAAIERLPDEPSARVRRAIFDLWVRYQRRMAGRDMPRAVALFTGDADEVVRASLARFQATFRR